MYMGIRISVSGFNQKLMVTGSTLGKMETGTKVSGSTVLSMEQGLTSLVTTMFTLENIAWESLTEMDSSLGQTVQFT